MKNNVTKTHLLCSECFKDNGIKVNAYIIGEHSTEKCNNCCSISGKKLTKDKVEYLAYLFFVRGTTIKCDFGEAPRIQFNEARYQKSDNDFPERFIHDMALIEEAIKIGFFHYGPNLWMIGENYFLIRLRELSERANAITELIKKASIIELNQHDSFLRLRKNPKNPSNPKEYDSPPDGMGGGRFDSPALSLLYASENYNICIHECRVTIDDKLYIAVLKPTRLMKLIDLNHIPNDHMLPFEKITVAIDLLFNADSRSYEISRDIAVAVRAAGFDGIVYPSYFSAFQLGRARLETSYGLPLSTVDDQYGKKRNIENIAIFGHPVEEELVTIEHIHHLKLKRIDYDFFLAPLEYNAYLAE